jgi:hypothetical protein
MRVNTVNVRLRGSSSTCIFSAAVALVSGVVMAAAVLVSARAYHGPHWRVTGDLGCTTRAAARYTGTHGSRTRGSQAWRVATGQYTRLLLLAGVRDGSSKMLSLARYELSKRLFLCPTRLLLNV